MSEGRGRRRVGVVVRRHIDRLDRGNGSLLGGSDTFLQLTHLCRQIGLIAHRRGHAPQEGRHFRSRLGKAENIVNEEQHVLAFLVAEIFGNRQSGQTHP